MTDLAPLLEAFSGEVSVAYARFDRLESYTYCASTRMPSASLIKLPILLTTLEGVASGTLDPNERVPVGSRDRVGGSGILKTLRPGLEPTLHDLLTLMIVVSDNTATNMVIDRVGQGAVNAFCQQHGLYETGLVGKLQLPEAEQNEAQWRGERNHTCAVDTLGLLMSLARGDLLPPPQTEQALTILKQQQYTEAFARYLPTDPELDTPFVQVASKSGYLRGVWHDAGIVFRGDEPLYALVVMTKDSADQRFHFDHEGVLLIAEVSRRVYRHVTGV